MTWNADPEIFTIGFFSLRYYSLAFLFGFLIGYYYVSRLFYADGRSEEEVSSLFTHVFLGTIIGARLAHCLFYEPGYYLSNPLEIVMVWKGGLASHGGYTGIMISVWLYLRKHRDLNFFWLCDRIAPPAILTGGLIRIGNFFNSEIYGHPADVPWAIIFQKVDNVPRHPVQLYESIGYLILALVLFLLFKKYRNKWVDGQLLGFTMIFAFSWRIFCEFFKVHQAEFASNWTLNMGQWLSVPFIFIGIFLFLGRHQKVSWLQFLAKSPNQLSPPKSNTNKSKANANRPKKKRKKK